VGFYHFVDLGHEVEVFGESDDDFLLVGDVLGGEGAAFVILEPFLAGLVAADAEAPDGFGHFVKAATACGSVISVTAGVDPDGVIGPVDLGDFLGLADELGDGCSSDQFMSNH